ncbi:MAG: NAD-dependent epimerase/dehydratase family protein [Pedobacter sp.]|nr:MAG: NAD-dependent epimerase/dehydratase family protein [Pedobacter sp.]
MQICIFAHFNNMILVTGATGFLGAEVARQLAQKGEHLRCTKRASSTIPTILLRYGDLIHWIEADMLDVFALEDALDDVTRVYHCAAWVSLKQKDKKQILTATVPGCVQTDLIKAGILANPYTGLNEASAEWVEKTDWNYKRTLNINAALMNNEFVHLVFEGLDTYATVLFNGKEVLKADNMFRKWVVNIKPHLKLGQNIIEVRFASVVHTATPLAMASSIKYPADNEKGSIKISPFVRKAQFQFGWDFAPRLLTTGIWKPVYIESGKVLISDLYAEPKIIDNKKAVYSMNISIEAWKERTYTITLTDTRTGKRYSTFDASLKKGSNNIVSTIEIKDPKLWWPNGTGGQHLYGITAKIYSGDGAIASKSINIGVRKIEVVNKPDNIGESFYFKVNEKNVYIKGANFVPVNSLIDPKDSVRLTGLFHSMKESNFNMVRVWGGGYYESDLFYRLADKHGILVWQDFPFACTMYPSGPKFLKSVTGEAVDNIKRLRNHPSLALWCGNNEVAVGWQNWGWQKTYGYSKADSTELIHGYNKLFKKLLPELVSKYDSERFYFHSSPVSNWGKPDDFNKGDNHYWGVYHGEEPFAAYKTHIPRFNSEFGFQSFPSWETLQHITQSKEPELEGTVLTARQKSYKGNKLLKKYMDWYYQPPATTKAFAYLSQLQQAEGMRTAILSSRAAMPHNMGVLMWQLNDVWPAISWSAIEFNGQWKAAQYFIRDAYKKLTVDPELINGNLQVTIVSDSAITYRTELTVRKFGLLGKEELLKKRIITVEPGVSKISIPADELGEIDAKSQMLLTEVNGSSACLYLVPVKDLLLADPFISWSISSLNGKKMLNVRSDVLVKNICLEFQGANDLKLSNNYFDILPGRNYKVELKSLKSTAYLRQNFKWMAVKNQKR